MSAANTNDPMKALVGLYQRGDFAAVIAQGEALTKTVPKAFALWNILGASYAQTGQFGKAKKMFERAAKLRPDQPDPHNNLGNVLKELGETQAALIAYKKALETDPKYAKAYNNIGALLVARGQLDDAAKYLARALKLEPGYAEAHSNMGNVLSKRGAMSEAKAAYERAVQVNPRYAEAHYNLGVIAQEQGDTIAAEACYLRAIQLRPNHVDALRNLGVTLKDRKMLDKARLATERALQFAPRHVETLVNLGLIHVEADEHKQAIAVFDRALAIDPNHMPALLGKADALQEDGQVSKGIALLQHTYERFPDALEPCANLGLMLQRQGKPQAALDIYAKAFETHPAATALFQNRALAMAEMGDLHGAILSLVAAIEADPANDTAARSLAALPVGVLEPETVAQLRGWFEQLKDQVDLDSSRYFFEADVLKHEGDWAAGFDALVTANRAKLAESDLDTSRLETELRELAATVGAWTPKSPQVHQPAIAPIFIFGTSRSGKSLLEGLLAQDPSVAPQFEALRMVPETDTGLGLEDVFYVDQGTLEARGIDIVTSTNPHSLTEITKLADGLPGAMFVFVRRDPFDVGAEMFATSYARGNEYAYDSDSIMSYIDAYNSVADLFIQKLATRALLVSFDDILSDPAAVMSRIGDLTGKDLHTGAATHPPANLAGQSKFRALFKEHVEKRR